MKKLSLLFGFLLFFSFTLNAEAHPGRTDSNGGHNCTPKSVAKGLCTEFHYHNGGGSSTPQTSPSSTPKVQEPVYNPKVYYDNGYKAGYSKGIEIGYQKGDTDVESTDSNDDFKEGWTAGFDVGYAEGLEKKEEEEKATKDKAEGAAKGKIDGKTAYAAGKEINAYTHKAESSDVYVKAYNESFISSWEMAKVVESCFQEGYNQGMKQDEVVVSETCEEESLRSEFEKGVKERDTKEIEKYTKQGEAAGYEVAELVIPKEAKKPSYQAAFEKAYDDGKSKRKEDVEQEGYDSAFKQVDFVNEVYTDNEVLGTWYKEGFESNKIAKEIKTNAQLLGEESSEYFIAEEYKVNDDSLSLYDSLFEKGQKIKEQKEREQRNLMLAVGAIGAPAAGGLYFWNRKRKNKVQ